jgi:hypothetical protein
VVKYILTQARLKELLHYNPKTGLFTWRVISGRKYGRAKPGKAILSASRGGYVQIKIDFHNYSGQRLAFLYATGRWPLGEIDHINGVRSDNRLSNLRDVSHKINCQNRRKADKRNRFGLLGVSMGKSGRFEANLTLGIKGMRSYIGRFDTAEEAHAAYLERKRKYHPGNTL